MPEEEKNEGQGNPSSASEENQAQDQNQGQDQGQKPEDQGQETGTADQSAELKKQIEESTQKIQTLSRQTEQAGFNIQRLKDEKKKLVSLLEDNGIDVPQDMKEGGAGFSEERVRQIIQESNAPLAEELKGLKTTLSEIARAGKVKPSQGGGEGGQKPPEKKKAPETSSEEQRLLKMAGLVWDSDKEAYVKKDNDGKIIRIYRPDEIAKTIS